jgi:predicted nucleotidyltransferase component of viral defense system
MDKHLLYRLKNSALNAGVELKTVLMDEIQSFFLEEFYKNSSSIGSVLFGGGRFRHINESIRFSIDLDFFETKDFEYEKVLDFISGKFIKLLENRFGISSRVINVPPWQISDNVKTIRLLVFDNENDFSQIEIDFDFIKRQPAYECERKLLKNVVIVTSNDAEALEEKLISIYERRPIKIRDIFDFWYYRNLVKKLNYESINKKIMDRCISEDSIKKQLLDFSKHREYYIKEIKNIIRSCGEKRDEVQNLLKLDINIIIGYVINTTNEYILQGTKDK